jgi:glutamate-ammonia-ligase adenylyltransferase
MSRLAEVALASAVALHHPALAADFGEPRDEAGMAQKLVIVGMGKLGGAELNVSSDIDIVFVYPEDGETDGKRALGNREFFERLGRRVIAALHEITPEGFVFRVDTRLRPYGESGPLAVPYSALEQYLVTQGRAWERYAWL